MSTPQASPAGWHGKLPTLGDFATRRLPADFVPVWDAWLSAGLAQLQQQAGWLDAYLQSPSWRFLLMPGVLPGTLGATPWAGVLMPSVDRVGRYYPLTLALPLAGLPEGEDAIDRFWGWLQQLDEVAADALHDDWTVDRLEAELARLGGPPVAAPVAAARGTMPPPRQQADGLAEVTPLSLEGARHAGLALAAQAGAAWQAQSAGRAFWYAQPDLDNPRLLRSNGLSPHDLVPRLLGGVDDNPGSLPPPAHP